MIALLAAKRQGLLKVKHLFPNIIAGIIVGVVALPLSMAFAIASGAKPEQGLYTAIIAGFLTSTLGGSSVQIAGPTGAFIVILSAITAKYGITGLQVATIMAGIMLLLMGVTRLGTAIKYIPTPVIVGFTSGIAVIIFVGQWKDFFGLTVKTSGEQFHHQVYSLLSAFPDFNHATTGLALFSLALMIITPRIPVIKRIPAPLIAMVTATVLEAIFKFKGVATIGSAFGGIPSGLPSFALPDISMTEVIALVGPAFTIAMLGSIESLLSAVVADGMAGTRHNSNQELIGQGISNIVAPFFGGFASTGAIARTATNIRNGGTSPIAGIVHALTLILIMLLFAPLAVYIPLCALSAILFIVAYNMSEMHRFWYLTRHAPRSDVAILITTFLLTLFVNLVVAVNIGVILASLIFMHRMAQSVKIAPQQEADLIEHLPEAGYRLPKNTMIYSINGPLFFGAAESFEHTLLSLHADVSVLILRLHAVPFIDATGLSTLEDMLGVFKRKGKKIILCEANNKVERKIKKAKLQDIMGKHMIFTTVKEAINAAKKIH